MYFSEKNIGWLPLQFAYQSCAKTRDANSPKMVEAVLKYYDSIAGTNFTYDMNHKRESVSNMRARQGEYTFTEILARCNLAIDKEPTHVKAKVLNL